MENEKLVDVLNEVLEELQDANRSLKQLSGTVTELGASVRAFEQKEIKTEPPDLKPVIEQCEVMRKEVRSGLNGVAGAVERQPKPVVRRISLFPENDREGHFKFLIRWVLGVVVAALVIKVTYTLISEYLVETHLMGQEVVMPEVKKVDSVKTKRIR